MVVAQFVVRVVLITLLGTLAFGVITRRIPWRSDGCCCPSDPAKDARMRPHLDASQRRRG